VVDKRTIVFGTPDEVKKVLKRGGDAKLSEWMETLIKRADLSRAVAVVVDTTEFRQIRQMVSDYNVARGIEGMVTTAEVGDDLFIETLNICKDVDAAKKLADWTNDQMDETRKQIKGQSRLEPLADVFDTVNVEQRGKEVTQTITVSPKPIKLLMEQLRLLR